MTIRKRTFPIATDEYSEKALKRLNILKKYDELIVAKCKKDIALNVLKIS